MSLYNLRLITTFIKYIQTDIWRRMQKKMICLMWLNAYGCVQDAIV